MKKILILFFVAIAITSCDDKPTVRILGNSKIEQTEYGKYICRIDGNSYHVPWVVTKNSNGQKDVVPPVHNEDVTMFSLGTSQEVEFFRGHNVSSDEIRELYPGGLLMFTLSVLLFLAVCGLFDSI